MRLDHLLSKEHSHPSPPTVWWGDSSLVEHWLLSLAGWPAFWYRHWRQWSGNGRVGDPGWLDTLLGPEETGGLWACLFDLGTGPVNISRLWGGSRLLFVV